MAKENDWRASVVIPAELADKIIEMRKRDEYARCSLSEIIRILIEKGLERKGYRKQ